MQSKARSVDEYLKEVPSERLEAMKKLRELCVKYLANHLEGMTYGMPSYSKDGSVSVAFNSQKNYIALYILKKEVLDVYRDQLKDIGKGCIRFKKPSDIDFTIVGKVLRDTARSKAQNC